MREVKLIPEKDFGRKFIPDKFLPEGQDEYYLRNEQSAGPSRRWRHLRAAEVEALVKNAVTCEDWDSVLVTDPFHTHLVRNCHFCGLIRIGRLEAVVLQHHELQTPAGITDSSIISCDLGDNCAIHHVRYLAHYIVGDRVILLNIDEMQTTNHAKFGNGVLKEGESNDVRIWMDLMNEAGGRAVPPFDGMTTGDAYLWAKYRDDADLMARLDEITQRQFDPRRGFYGTVGNTCVIKNCGIIKDVKIGSHAYIKGTNKLKNLTINSSSEEPTQIGEGVELVNGIVGLGCHIFYGSKGVRFVMGNNANLKYGARLIHSFLGDNSTVSCCEILNNLIFPAHEQHHNNSFLISALLMGQSNVAAGATIGSNHNSRANDGEIQAGRGFWPGLCTTLKHSCRFASFVLLAKGNYPSELDVPLPFSLLADDTARARLVMTPAYWWLHNMYALKRNTWKFLTRDKRVTKTQKIEFDCLAPDTAEEMFQAMGLLELWTAKASLRSLGEAVEGRSDEELAFLGRRLLAVADDQTEDLEILGENIENSQRKVVIRKAHQGYHAYRQMLHYYAVKNLLDYMVTNPAATWGSMCEELAGPREGHWVNIGGQLVSGPDMSKLLADIRAGLHDSWDQIHRAFDALWAAYPLQKQRHALATLAELLGTEKPENRTILSHHPSNRCLEQMREFQSIQKTNLGWPLGEDAWIAALDETVRIQEYVQDQVFQTRQKDHINRFRQTTFRNAAEMRAVVGTAEENSFVIQVRKETEKFKLLVDAVKQRELARVNGY
ncbi:MAG: DUF4954 family protein [Pirellulales bacterium]|nr:DUF4954 family protein [Pirellulales bacterium]